MKSRVSHVEMLYETMHTLNFLSQRSNSRVYYRTVCVLLLV